MAEEIRVRFLVNKATAKILYMEAGKDFVDVLLSFLQLPVATVLNMLISNKAGAVAQMGSISNVYESLSKLSDSSLLVPKASLTNPAPSSLQLSSCNQKLLPAPSASRTTRPSLYTCANCRNHTHIVSYVPGENCPYCSKAMNQKVVIVGAEPRSASPPSAAPTRPALYACAANCNHTHYSSVRGEKCPCCRSISMNREVSVIGAERAEAAGGYVKHYLSFIVTDDLCILPSSTIESIVLLNKLNLDKMSDLDSMEVSVTADEALELLKVSFSSRTALNAVFGATVTPSFRHASASFGK